MADPVAIFDRFPRASFASLDFPITKLRHRGGQRIALHEFPKVAGGQQEKLGRRPHIFMMSAIFDETMNDSSSVPYPGLYPGVLATLLGLWDQGITDELIVPGRGKYQCVLANYDATLDFRIRSGEEVELEFHEDALDAAFGLAQLTASVNGLAAPMQALLLAAQALQIAPVIQLRVDETTIVPNGSVLDAIANTVGIITGIQDQIQLYDQQLGARIEFLISTLQRLERSTQFLDNRNSAAFLALMDLWAAVQALQSDLHATQTPLRKYKVPRFMTIDQVSIALYDDATHASDLLDLNALDDGNAIPEGTRISYYAAA